MIALYVIAEEDVDADTAFFLRSRVDILGESVSLSDLVSTILLLGCAAISLMIYFQRDRKASSPKAVIWALMSAGLFVLAQDEFFEFHEEFDAWFHELTGIRSTEWTTQIDSVILLSYFVIALMCLWKYNSEIRRCAPFWRRFLVAGLSVALLSIVCDALSNLRSLEKGLFGQYSTAAHQAVIEIENSCELIAEAMFLLFFVSVYRFVCCGELDA